MRTLLADITVIVCTRDRPASFRRALASVLAQDTGGFEVIVVDGSDPPVRLPDDAPVPLRLIGGQREGEGQARAAGLREARGELVAWCDDDDAWSPDHLRLLREALAANPDAALVYASDGPLDPEAIRAGDILHRTAAARRAGGFDHSLGTMAAGDLWTRMAERGRLAPTGRRTCEHHSVPSAISPKDRAAARERLEQDREDTARRLGAVRERLAKRRDAIVPFDPDTWNESHRSLIMQATMQGPGSFPVVSQALLRELLAREVTVTLGPLREGPLSHKWAALRRPLERQDQLGFVFDFRTGPAELHCERVIAYSMWETTVIPAWQIEEINQSATMLYTTCRENARIARANGVEVPARVLLHGVDGRQFPYLTRRREPGRPFTFGSNGVFSIRKGIDLLMRAFEEEFAPGEPVRLLLKHTHTRYTGPVSSDPRVSIVGGFVNSKGLLDFLAGLDAYVLPSRGEGFGLTGLEAMATGLPLIATNWSGPTEYLDPADTYQLSYTLEETGGPRFQNRRQFGCWAEPDVGHLRELMRHLYEHRDEGIEAGRRASARVHRDWTWSRVAGQLIADFDLLARGLTPGGDE